MEKAKSDWSVQFLLTATVFVLKVFISSSVCATVRWYPHPYSYSSPWRLRQYDSNSLRCPAPRGQFNHPRYCDQFLNCWDGAAAVGQCPGGLVFSEAIAACDYPRNVDCAGREISQSFVPPDDRCQSPFGTFPNPHNCSQYIVCHSGVATINACPENTYYNSNLGVCTHERDPSCANANDVGVGVDEEPGPSGPKPVVPAGTPTVPPTAPPSLPFEPKPPLDPDSPPPTPQQPNGPPQHPLRPKPPLDLDPEHKPDEPPPDPSKPQLQEPELTSTTTTRKPTVGLKPKPPLKPEDTSPSEKPPISIPDSVPSESSPSHSVPPLNHSSLRPPTAPGPTNVGPSTTPEPVDGVDDPHILFPFLPQFPGIFRCPVPNSILPIVGDCESVIICVHGAAHHFRCQAGHRFDLQRGRCAQDRNTVCSVKQMHVSKHPDVLYAYLSLSQIRKHFS